MNSLSQGKAAAEDVFSVAPGLATSSVTQHACSLYHSVTACGNSLSRCNFAAEDVISVAPGLATSSSASSAAQQGPASRTAASRLLRRRLRLPADAHSRQEASRQLQRRPAGSLPSQPAGHAGERTDAQKNTQASSAGQAEASVLPPSLQTSRPRDQKNPSHSGDSASSSSSSSSSTAGDSAAAGMPFAASHQSPVSPRKAEFLRQNTGVYGDVDVLREQFPQLAGQVYVDCAGSVPYARQQLSAIFEV